MKRLVIILVVIAFFTNCKKTLFTCDISSKKNTKTIDLQSFDTIEINPLIRLKIYDTTFNKMTIQTSEDVMENITYEFVNHRLILTNETDCLIQNDNAVADIQLYVTDLKAVIANTDLDISSGNLLRFNSLGLICENNSIGSNNIADFNLEIAIPNVNVMANGTSIFKLKGTCDNLFVGFFGVNPVFKGNNLKAQYIRVYQRSQNDMHLYPVQSITGDLYGYGDIYLYHRPPVINIEQHYAGHIYFVN